MQNDSFMNQPVSVCLMSWYNNYLLTFQEMSVMKQVVMNLSNRQYGEKKTKSNDLARPKSPSLYKPFGSFEPHNEPEVVKPGFITVVSVLCFCFHR